MRSEEGQIQRYHIGGRKKDLGRVLTKFRVNLVIPEEHSYGYVSAKGGDTYIMGIFNIKYGKGHKEGVI